MLSYLFPHLFSTFNINLKKFTHAREMEYNSLGTYGATM